ncbi:MAG: YfjI family protein [Firmicutes bacterium]|nr:YfjI family protein [Bacillota bacterium]
MLQEKDEIRERMRAMLTATQAKDSWRGLVATPPGSLLDRVIHAFQQASDIPLEIPFFVPLHIISAELLRRGIQIDFSGQRVRPDLWTIILAESGTGKTFTTGELRNTMEIDQSLLFPQAATTARFVMELAEHNNSLWIRDEILQLLKGMNTQTYLAEMKDLLLQVYDGDTVSRKTKKDTIVVEQPALTILGLNVYTSFSREMDTASLLDGLAQRFSYVIGRTDPDRPGVNYPIYDFRPYRSSIKSAWDDLLQAMPPNDTVYQVSDSGLEAFRIAFEMLLPPKDSKVPMSFFRRIMFRGVRYAVLYHLLLRKDNFMIDDQDMAWAGRLMGLHVKDAGALLLDTGDGTGSKFFQLLQKTEALRDKIAHEEQRPITARDIVRNIWGVENANMARGILSMLHDDHP